MWGRSLCGLFLFWLFKKMSCFHSVERKKNRAKRHKKKGVGERVGEEEGKFTCICTPVLVLLCTCTLYSHSSVYLYLAVLVFHCTCTFCTCTYVYCVPVLILQTACTCTFLHLDLYLRVPVLAVLLACCEICHVVLVFELGLWMWFGYSFTYEKRFKRCIDAWRYLITDLQVTLVVLR